MASTQEKQNILMISKQDYKIIRDATKSGIISGDKKSFFGIQKTPSEVTLIMRILDKC